MGGLCDLKAQVNGGPLERSAHRPIMNGHLHNCFLQIMQSVSYTDETYSLLLQIIGHCRLFATSMKDNCRLLLQTIEHLGETRGFVQPVGNYMPFFS